MLRKKLTAQTTSNAESRFTPRSTTPGGTYRREDSFHDDERTPFESLEDLTTKLLKVPKEEVDEKRAERD